MQIRNLTVDELVARTTAFRSWADFEKACHAGYVPTLRHGTPGANELADLCAQAGLRVWRGYTKSYEALRARVSP